MSTNKQISIQLKYMEETVQVNHTPASFQQLQSLVRDEIPELQNQAFTIQYLDEDNQTCKIKSDKALAAAIQFALQSARLVLVIQKDASQNSQINSAASQSSMILNNSSGILGIEITKSQNIEEHIPIKIKNNAATNDQNQAKQSVQTKKNQSQNSVHYQLDSIPEIVLSQETSSATANDSLNYSTPTIFSQNDRESIQIFSQNTNQNNNINQQQQQPQHPFNFSSQTNNNVLNTFNTGPSAQSLKQKEQEEPVYSNLNCHKCDGQGKSTQYPKEDCKKCNGTGKLKYTTKIRVVEFLVEERLIALFPQLKDVFKRNQQQQIASNSDKFQELFLQQQPQQQLNQVQTLNIKSKSVLNEQQQPSLLNSSVSMIQSSGNSLSKSSIFSTKSIGQVSSQNHLLSNNAGFDPKISITGSIGNNVNLPEYRARGSRLSRIGSDFECAECQSQITSGIRMNCTVCENLDLCEGCETKSTHQQGHKMIKIKVNNTNHSGPGNIGEQEASITSSLKLGDISFSNRHSTFKPPVLQSSSILAESLINKNEIIHSNVGAPQSLRLLEQFKKNSEASNNNEEEIEEKQAQSSIKHSQLLLTPSSSQLNNNNKAYQMVILQPQDTIQVEKGNCAQPIINIQNTGEFSWPKNTQLQCTLGCFAGKTQHVGDVGVSQKKPVYLGSLPIDKIQDIDMSTWRLGYQNEDQPDTIYFGPQITFNIKVQKP